MVRLPVTGYMLYDFVLILFVLIGGVALALKADNKWGWALVGLAVAWTFLMMRSRGLI